jgi:hypothetical protein
MGGGIKRTMLGIDVVIGRSKQLGSTIVLSRDPSVQDDVTVKTFPSLSWPLRANWIGGELLSDETTGLAN